MASVRLIGRDIVHRWEGNPLIGIQDVAFRCTDLRNACPVRVGDEAVLLVSIEDMEGYERIHVARRGVGTRFEVDPKPFLVRSREEPFEQHESDGVMDPRITFLEGVYYIMYVADGVHGYRLALARTEDFQTVERMGLVSEPDTKGGALFPERIGGRYARVERPGEGRSVWVSYSDDLVHWGRSERVLGPRSGFWDHSWVGVGAPPMRIDAGWLLIYYGAKDTSAGPIYRLGAAILDAENPAKVVGRANIPILAPRERYERIGDQPNIVFTTGALMEDDGSLTIYYGAADSCICVGTTSVEDIVAHCQASRKEF